jgi:hypothetical protein
MSWRTYLTYRSPAALCSHIGDERRDVLFAGLAEQLATRDRQDAPCSAALPWLAHTIPGPLPVLDLRPLAGTARARRGKLHS